MATTGTGLARGAIGLREVLFQSVIWPTCTRGTPNGCRK